MKLLPLSSRPRALMVAVRTVPHGMLGVRNIGTGRWFSSFSLVMAFASLAVAPVVLGPLGILTGMIAVCKGDRIRGMVGVTASATLGVTGYYLAGALLY